MGSAVKIPDLKSAPPGFINTFQRGCRSVVETKLPPRVLKRLKRLARADSSRVPARTCSLRESPSISRDLVRVVRVDPALLAGLPLSADPPHLPRGRQQVRRMLAAVGRAAKLCDGQKLRSIPSYRGSLGRRMRSSSGNRASATQASSKRGKSHSTTTR